MVSFAINAGFVFAFSIWIRYRLHKFKNEIAMLIEESDEKTIKCIEAKLGEFKTGIKAVKPPPGKEYYYEK